MRTTDDLRSILQSWPFEPGNHIRIVRGDDGREILQVRQPVGIEQYELEGRPDGLRPHDRESVLDYQIECYSAAKAAGKDADYTLDDDACAELFAESALYYYRYLHLFQLKDWKRVIRDTTRNLKLFDFVHQYAAREEDQINLEKWRPYITRMNAIARAMLEWEHQRHQTALQILKNAITRIEALDDLDDPTFKFERDRSLAVLGDTLKQLETNRPVSQIEKLERELKQAVDAQEFEQAAKLRDQIRDLKKKESPA